ncbi:hypothetical protein U7S25_000997 [Providencia rettgeri]|uniref:Uncharacterized protein n=1 Tax=Providencia rettgeri TaxID=587 RepID=A0AAW6UP18_PRORE|nr:hypothetical protein [Providencia rettgeri]EMA4781898.1 hypothetical protein [Providencia rettgeri]EMB0750371.1 hypothetical protein [Providencia rettgeri]EMB3081267.1 hypothetical protein [Providencia rettgeri]MCB6144315.1 hypothetical protein [Providencia rettgeri]MDI9095667.1 hypothetical protein [Providencia rettgeri]
MQFNLIHVLGVDRANDKNTLDVALRGSDGSIHNFTIDITGKTAENLTLRDVEKLAIQHAKSSFANCTNG